ncbi:hypothetical protein C2S52_018301 [Perilla frutescens var. hirtella]|nr:hypothetical protein C2S52_018301 [Perilla frutescens var. hirtella]
MILCPCKKCKNGICLSREEVEVHLKCVGFINGYTQWVAHGEAYNFSTPPSFHNEPSDVNNVQEMLNDAFGVPHDDVEMDGNDDNEIEEPNLEAKSFYKLVDDSQQELWPGCRSPSRVEMFDACFTDLNGDPPCAEVGAALEEMKEVQSKSPPGSRDSIGPSDSFAKVMGKDPHGRVRMVGLGVNPSDITGGIPSRSACYRMVLKNQVAMTRMEEKVDAATKLITNLQEKMQQNANNISTARRPASPGQSSNSINLEHTFQVGDTVLLKSLFDYRKIVAKGYVRSVDPNQDVGGKRLGLNWCEVQISIPVEWDEDLIRPYSNLSTIGDAIGTCIAWPRHLVTNADDQD